MTVKNGLDYYDKELSMFGKSVIVEVLVVPLKGLGQ
jgi:hypothetical protein